VESRVIKLGVFMGKKLNIEMY